MDNDQDMYSMTETEQIRMAARKNGFDGLSCPRATCEGRLQVHPRLGQDVEKDEPARGVRFGDHSDVLEASFECLQCRAYARSVSLLPNEDEGN